MTMSIAAQTYKADGERLIRCSSSVDDAAFRFLAGTGSISSVSETTSSCLGESTE